MNYKDLLTIIFSSSVTSAIVTTFLSMIIEFIKGKYEQSKINNERKYNEEKEDKQKLTEIYINAIRIIQLIKLGFSDETYQQVVKTVYNPSQMKVKEKELDKKVERVNNLIEITAPLMRLYATNEIFELFSKLIKYSRFSYSKNIISQFLLYSFDRKFSYMCRIMQKDLGLRIENFNLPKFYICPNCGERHNSEEVCPRCGISWTRAIDIEDKFNKDCIEDENLQKLINTCASKGKDSLSFITYPVNKSKWKENMKKFNRI